MLIHLVDVSGASGRDPVEDFDTLQRELGLYSAGLLEKPMLVAANKIDALDDPTRLERLEARAGALGMPFFAISAVTGRGVPALVEASWPYIAESPRTSPSAMNSRPRVGLIGGTFDPIHVGHLSAAQAAGRALDLDLVRFIPSARPPHRPDSPQASEYHRLEMTRLAVADAAAAASPARWEVSDQELRRDGPSFTIDTLGALQREGLSPLQLFFIIGADAFAEIASWHRYPAVLDAAHFAVVTRPGTTLDQLRNRLPALRDRMTTLRRR